MEMIKKNFGFGCMRLPMKDGEVDTEEFSRMVDAFLENEFNYFDTAHGYLGGKSETALRTCLTSRYPRDRYVLTDKLTNFFFKTKILVLDEPTVGLDPKERVRFRNLIADFSKDKIVILSTHIVSDVEYVADTILMMKSGKLLLRGSVEGVTDSMRGKVWKYVARGRDADWVNERFCVANLHHLADGDVEVRVINDTQPFAEAVPLQPTLEDLYLYHFQNQ